MNSDYNKSNGKAAPIKTRVAIYKYFSAHGQLPRGCGRWGFHPDFNVDALSPEIFWSNGTFAEAKRKAVAHFTGKAAYVDVLS
jgi:hypothetical protein